MSAASDAFSEMRRIIDAPAREAVLWQHMTNDQRSVVLRSAGLPWQWRSRAWEHFTTRERVRILDQIQSFAAWAKHLQVPK